jgi:hypothetical protein
LNPRNRWFESTSLQRRVCELSVPTSFSRVPGYHLCSGSPVVYQSKTVLQPEPWSKYLEEDKGKVADWSYPWVYGNCTSAKFADF